MATLSDSTGGVQLTLVDVLPRGKSTCSACSGQPDQVGGMVSSRANIAPGSELSVVLLVSGSVCSVMVLGDCGTYRPPVTARRREPENLPEVLNGTRMLMEPNEASPVMGASVSM